MFVPKQGLTGCMLYVPRMDLASEISFQVSFNATCICNTFRHYLLVWPYTWQFFSFNLPAEWRIWPSSSINKQCVDWGIAADFIVFWQVLLASVRIPKWTGQLTGCWLWLDENVPASIFDQLIEECQAKGSWQSHQLCLYSKNQPKISQCMQLLQRLQYSQWQRPTFLSRRTYLQGQHVSWTAILSKTELLPAAASFF